MKTQTYKIGTLIETKDGFKTILGVAQFKDRFEYITAMGNVEPKDVNAAYTRIDKVEVKAKKAKTPKKAKEKEYKASKDIVEVESMAELSHQEPEVDPFAE